MRYNIQTDAHQHQQRRLQLDSQWKYVPTNTVTPPPLLTLKQEIHQERDSERELSLRRHRTRTTK